MATDALAKVAKSLGPPQSPGGVPALLERARQAFPDDRRAAATELNVYFQGLSREPTRENADLLLAALETDELEGLVAADGRRCRTVAAESLLALGYPYALEISPEHLDRLRREQRALIRRGPWTLVGLSWLVLLGAMAALLYFTLLT